MNPAVITGIATRARDGEAPLTEPAAVVPASAAPTAGSPGLLRVSLLTGGDDRPYALGMASALLSQGIGVDFIGSDALDAPELHTSELLRFLNLRGSQREDATFFAKTARILRYYIRLVWYTATARTDLVHILWNNRFELFDRTCLMLYYRSLGRRVLLTAHNINAARRDSRDSWLNRLTLRVQYRLCNHIFVHTTRMKTELVRDFGVPDARVTVIPFGVNTTVPSTALSPAVAKRNLGLTGHARALLFFGQIAPYKGLDCLLEALSLLEGLEPPVHLIIAGKVKRGHEEYWSRLQEAIAARPTLRLTCRMGFIPDDEVELYFKAADAVVLPYREIFQSGVPFLAYGFGVPVIATDVGSLREDVVDGVSGFICRPHDPAAIASAIRTYFESDLYRNLGERRSEIRNFALEQHSWERVGRILHGVYLSTCAG